MRLTTRTIRSYCDARLGAIWRPRPHRLADISSRQDISLSYLEQLFAKLRRRELVRSIRGPGGGYRLSRPGEEIFVAEIIDAVDERVDATGCSGQSDCQDGHTCLTHHLWSDLSEQIHHFLSDISLASLVQRRDVQAVSARQRLRGESEQTIVLTAID